MELDNITYKQITRDESKYFVKELHYLHRMPPLSFAYGAYHGEKLVGVLTFGKPPSNSLCKGICGEDYSKHVIELNRLYTLDNTPKNTESKLISYGLKDLKKKGNYIVVSYADKSMGHSGYIYQATNWLYTGLSAKRTDVYVGKNGHSRTYTEEQRKFVIRSVRSMKHRYVYFTGNKRFKRNAKKALNYPVIDEYPKDEVIHYGPDDEKPNILYNKITKDLINEADFLKKPKEYLTDEQFEDYKDIYTGNLRYIE